ncbi:MAG: D-sedoheptulose 7-phosphate isomerase [Thiobacillaceae bacterium]|nr:D-sedoheptulose 7-phosphate isomerase [Thiobacillaceae bacterium]MDW8323000.1 D-sedoheptulose 7-phosphate isomerase [Burkholderiales bacterium]
MEDQLTAAIAAQLRETAATLRALSEDDGLHATLAQVAQACIAALTHGNKILFAGNGGSAADAQHLAGELVSRFGYDRPGLAAFALTTDTSVLTAIGNDYGYEQLFARQVEAVGRPGDILIAISTSGRSPNVLNALRVARDRRLVTVGLTGRSGGHMPPLCDYCLRAPADSTPRIQECHISLGHTLCFLIEQALYPRT